jgi:hypothetical protein
LSGIRNPEVLAKIGAKTKVDLPASARMCKTNFSSLLPLVQLGFLLLRCLPTLTITHQELKDPEKYNTQGPMADETVLKD